MSESSHHHSHHPLPPHLTLRICTCPSAQPPPPPSPPAASSPPRSAPAPARPPASPAPGTASPAPPHSSPAPIEHSPPRGNSPTDSSRSGAAAHLRETPPTIPPFKLSPKEASNCATTPVSFALKISMAPRKYSPLSKLDSSCV